MARHALEPERDRVHALIGRHLIDEALDGERVEHMADGAPMLELDAMRNTAPLDMLVGHPVVGVLDPGDEEELSIADNTVFPPRDIPAGVGGSLQALERLRPEHALGDVLLARPDQLHWTSAPPWR